jgi:osmotically-inducible protein OsmY
VKVFAALSADNTLNTRYMSAGAKGDVVVLVGSVGTKAQLDQALSDAKKVEGVKQVRSQLAIQQATK